MSSNYVLLNQLFSYAKLHLEPGSEGQGESSTPHQSNLDAHTPSSATLHAFNNGPGGQTGVVSIVNLLSNEDTLIPPSRAKTPPDLTAEESHRPQGSTAAFRCRTTDPTIASHGHGRSNRARQTSSPSVLSGLHTPQSREASSHVARLLAKRRLEREYVRNYFHNLHYLHPMLDPADFTAMCEDYVWSAYETNDRARDRRHFFALYNIVVAVGALVAGADVLNEFGRELKMYGESLRGRRPASPPFTSQMFSRIYFRKSWTLLGDVFEVCTLESAQTLLLMVSALNRA